MQQKIDGLLVPKLRFPEFLDAGEWRYKPVKEVFTIFQGYAFASKDSVKNGIRWIKIADVGIHKIESDSPSYLPHEFIEKYKEFLIKKGDYIIALTRPILNNQLKIARANSLCEGALLNQRVGKLLTAHNLDFIYFLMQTEYLIGEIEKNISGNDPPNLSVQKIENISVCIPLGTEQQKIADCLSSISDRITLEAQKLDTLKAHKKGLMQQLFPAEGETLPKLRFPEFQDSGEWEEKLLSEVTTSIFDGTHQTPKYKDKGIPFFSVENIVSGKTNKFISKEDYLIATNKNKPEKGDILITRIGNIGFSTVVNWDYEFSIYVTLAVVKSNKKFNAYYLHSFMQSDRYQKEIQSKSLLNAVPCKINMDELRKTKVLLPSSLEQQKIADCLSSLDELIAAQTQAIDTLKTHKKGLMQQLFPSVEEVKA